MRFIRNVLPYKGPELKAETGCEHPEKIGGESRHFVGKALFFC